MQTRLTPKERRLRLGRPSNSNVPHDLRNALLVEAAAPLARRSPNLASPLRVGFFVRNAVGDLPFEHCLLVDGLAQKRPEAGSDRDQIWNRVGPVLVRDGSDERDDNLVESICGSCSM